VMSGGRTPQLVRRAAVRFDGGAAKGFLHLAAAMLLSGFLATSIPLAVRAIAVRRFGLPGVGFLDVAWNISMNYILLALASFSTYYIPSLSRLQKPRDRQELIHQVLRLSIVIMVPLVVAATVLKPAVVRILYTPAFLPALEIMRWMLIGDYFKATSWVFSFTMIAYADVKTVVWTELAWGGVSLGGAAFAMMHLNSLQAVGANFMFVYVTYLAFTLFYVGSRRHFVLDAPIAGTWFIGLALILAASAHTWSDLVVRPALAIAYVGIATFFSWTVLTAEERRGIRNGLCQGFRRSRLTLPEPP
jgi:O-antigen/teichoic acid export membrane protein